MNSDYTTAAAPRPGMVQVDGGECVMGSDGFYPEERPSSLVSVEPFLIDKFAVSNTEFQDFVDATDYVTTAEVPLNQDESSGLPDEYYSAGSLVFQMTDGPVSLGDPRNWWCFVPGANWRHPEGPGSTMEGRMNHPVVHVSYFDAVAYAQWAGKSLPFEKEWECAARAGSKAAFPWGDTLEQQGTSLANTWQGAFPWSNQKTHTPPFTMAVDAFEPSAFGAFNIIGNVWEWTSDLFRGPHRPGRSCCPHTRPVRGQDRLVVKGGSYLCSAGYCERYRPAARSPQEASASAGHIGFRCAIR